jgi:HPt (histidine-containing phosphotransfer) domain-containing protein
MNKSNRLYDLETLYEMAGNDKKFINDIISIFLTNVTTNANDLVDAYNHKQWDKVYFIAHKMKSNIDLLSIESLKNDIRIVETSAKNGTDAEQLSTRVSFIHEIIHRSAKQMKEEFHL